MKRYLASVVVVSLISLCLSANPLICYQCSSSTIGAESFCGEKFDQGNIPVNLMKELNISVERVCNSTIDSEHERPVCRKTMEETMTGEIIVKRFCYYTNKSDPLDNCNSTSTNKNVRQIFCQDCDQPHCNKATHLTMALQYIFFFFFCTFLLKL